jgi:Zn-dependent membrane protease YugP
MELFGFFYFDPKYFLYVGPAMLLALWAEIKVKAAYGKASRFRPRAGLTGAQTAQRILNFHGISNVAIEPVNTFMGDHYDPRHKVLRLSPDVYHGQSLASMGIAAHEVGHAIQDAGGYGPLAIRNGLVPMASIGSNIAFFLVFVGIIMNFTGMTVAGLVLFSVFVLFQIVNLPVEYDASRRARQVLLSNGLVTAEEDQVVGKVLSAAALTYVAATLTAILTLLYYVSLVNRRRD